MNARRALRGIGLLLGCAALAWIALRFVQSGALSVLPRIPAGPWQLCLAVAAAAAGYAAALGLLAGAWWRLLAGLSSMPLPARATMATWSVSQYGKYLPGNVAHYALRHAWSRRQSLSHATLGIAALLEAVLLLLVALAVALAGGADALAFPGLDARVLLGVLLAACVAGAFVLRGLRRSRLGTRLPSVPPAALAWTLACDAAFFAATATILWALGRLVGAETGWAPMLAAGAASWAAGFVVIGAPAGLGVREAAFVAMTAGALGEDRALLLIALYRLVTFFGDTLAFAAGSLAMRGARAHGRASGDS